jgi:hypothetical protein
MRVFPGVPDCAAVPTVGGMSEELKSRTIEVSCVGRPPSERVARASGVSDLRVEGLVLQCRVTGSVQPFLEALSGSEILSLTTSNDLESTQPPADSVGRSHRRTTPMRPYLVNARVTGALFIAATAASLIDGALLQPLLTAPDYLTAISLNPGRVTAGAFFQILSGLSCMGIAVALYPVLRRYAESFSLGAVVLRTAEALMYLVSALGALLLVALSKSSDGASPTSTATLTGDLLLALRSHASVIGILAFYLGASLYYTVMARSRVVPRWLSWWGLAGTTLGLITAVAVFCGAITLFSPIQIAFNIPIALNELVLAGWLLTQGFATTPATIQQPTPLHPAASRL